MRVSNKLINSKPIGKTFKETDFIGLVKIFVSFPFFAVLMCLPQMFFKSLDQLKAVEVTFSRAISIFC